MRPCISVDMTSYSDRLHFSTSGEFLMGTFGIDFDMGLLKRGSRDDIDSCRTSFDTIAMTVESLMRRLFDFFYIFLVNQPPLSQVAIPASHDLKPLTGA